MIGAALAWFAPAGAFIARNRWAQIVGLACAVLACFFIWKTIHDHNVRKAERARLEQVARDYAEKQKAKADKNDVKRQEAINETVSDLRNSSSTDDWFERMRRRQSDSTAP